MLHKIRNRNFLRILFFKLFTETKYLNILKYNKGLQTKLNLSLENYKKYNQIKIEVIPIVNLKEKDEENIFINTVENESLYHIYFNESNEEIERKYIKNNEKISKIIILIDIEVESLRDLFHGCESIKEIKFISFNRKNIIDMGYMFAKCSNLINLDISKIKTDNVTHMEYMFNECSKLENLNLSNFKTDKVEYMNDMFSFCSNLSELNLSNFKIDCVKNMNSMFSACYNLKELNISSFKTEQVEDMSQMLYECHSLQDLDISNLNINEYVNVKIKSDKSPLLISQKNINAIFYGCSEDLELKIRKQKPDVNEKVFNKEAIFDTKETPHFVF